MTQKQKAHEEANKSRIAIIREIGFMGYKFLIVLNSGAFIVLLTFLGNVQKSHFFALNIEQLKCAMWLFLAAIAMTFLSMTIAYISAQLHVLNKTLPGGSTAAGHMIWLLAPVVVSFLFFLAGGIAAISGIHEF